MSHSRDIASHIRAEIRTLAAEFSNEFADRLPENNYWAFSLYTQVLPVILGEVTHFVLPQTPVAGPVWNYLDAASSVATGINQLFDNDTHRPVATKLKGLVNIGSGVQLIALTALNFALYGGPAFAAAFGAGFLLSLDETARAFARKYNEEYWLKDSLAQLEKLTEVKLKLKNEMNILRQAGDDVAAARWAYKRKKERLKKLADDQKELERDILFRVSAKRFEQIERAEQENPDAPAPYQRDAVIERQLNACSEACQNTRFIQNLRRINNAPAVDASSIQEKWRPEFEKARSSATRKTREKEIARKCNEHVKSAVKDSFIWGVAFAGVLLACIPGCQFAGLVVVGVASALYLAKNTSKFCSAIKRGFSSLFCSSKTRAAEEENDPAQENLLKAPRFGRPAVA